MKSKCLKHKVTLSNNFVFFILNSSYTCVVSLSMGYQMNSVNVKKHPYYLFHYYMYISYNHLFYNPSSFHYCHSTYLLLKEIKPLFIARTY